MVCVVIRNRFVVRVRACSRRPIRRSDDIPFNLEFKHRLGELRWRSFHKSRRMDVRILFMRCAAGLSRSHSLRRECHAILCANVTCVRKKFNI